MRGPVPGSRTGIALGRPHAPPLPRRVRNVAGVDLSASRLALADTLYLGLNTGTDQAALATDASQYLDNEALVAGVVTFFEASPATRFQILAPYTVEAVAYITTTTTGRVCFFGTTASSTGVSLRIGNTPGLMDVIMAPGGVGTVVGSLTLPGVSSLETPYLLAMATRPNPDTTGASDACTTDLSAWNLDTGEKDRSTFNHADRGAPTNAAFIWGGSSTGGASPFTGRLMAVRFSDQYHTPEETYEEFVTPSGAPTLQGEERMAVDVPPRSSTVGDDGNFAGPVFLLGAAAARENDLRLAGPLVSVVYRSRPTLVGNRATAPDEWLYVDPGSASHQDSYVYLQYLHQAMVPASVNRAHVRVFLQKVNNRGVLTCTCLSMSQPGHYVRPPTSPVAMTTYRASVSLPDDYVDGVATTAGRWLDLGTMRIARDNDGASYFALAFYSSSTSQSWVVKALQIDPVFTSADGSPIGLAG